MQLGVSLGLSPRGGKLVPAILRFFGVGGSDAADGLTEGTKWETLNYAQVTAPDTGTIYATDGEQDGGGAHHSIKSGSNMIAENSRGVTLTNGDLARLMFVGSGSTGSPTRGGIELDGAGFSDYLVQVSSSAGADGLTLQDIGFIDTPDIADVVLSKTEGTWSVLACDILHDLDRPIVIGTNAATAGQFDFSFCSNTVTVDTTANPTVPGVVSIVPIATKGSYDFNWTSCNNTVTVDIPVTITNPYPVFDFNGGDVVDVSDNTVVVTSLGTPGVTVVNPLPVAGFPLDVFTCDNNLVEFNCESGYGLAMHSGDTSVLSFINTGSITNSVVQGQYYPVATPHMFAIGRGTLADRMSISDCIAADGFVGFMSSISPGADTTIIEDNLAVDCYGPSYYAKGNVDCTIRNNRAVVSDTVAQRNRAVIAVIHQDAFINDGATITGNTVTMQSDNPGEGGAGDWYALAGDENPPTCPTDKNLATFSGNTYNVPDTISTSALLFVIEGTHVDTATWQAKYTNETVNFLPQAEIDAIVDAAVAELAAAKLTTGAS